MLPFFPGTKNDAQMCPGSEPGSTIIIIVVVFVQAEAKAQETEVEPNSYMAQIIA
jgi:hypothetical protein